MDIKVSNGYNQQEISRVLGFLIPRGRSVLYLGPRLPGIIQELGASRCVAVCPDSAGSDDAAEHIRSVCAGRDDETSGETFDYIILNGVSGGTRDFSTLLKELGRASHPATRVIVCQRSPLLHRASHWAERLGLKRKEGHQDLIPVRDVISVMEGVGFRAVRTFSSTVCPVRFGVIGPLINRAAAVLPVPDVLMYNRFVVARPDVRECSGEFSPRSLSIVLTVRDEKGNIEPIVTSLPQICAGQEILFVEGHSTDGTREEIDRVIGQYPEKNIRVLTQPGKGQGDAIRVGFKAASGDVIILYEGDGTSSPEDIRAFYDAVCDGRYEFVQGSRFIYPFDDRSMSFAKKAGNIFFARWFSRFLGRRSTDVLSGIKAITRKEFDTIYDHWGFLGLDDPFGDFELLYGAFRFGLKSCEVPMHYRPRPYGESKSRLFGHGFYLLRMAVRGFMAFRMSSTYKRNN